MALPDQGVAIHDRAAEDRAIFREAARIAEDDGATETPATARTLESHKAVIDRIGLGGPEGSARTPRRGRPGQP